MTELWELWPSPLVIVVDEVPVGAVLCTPPSVPWEVAPRGSRVAMLFDDWRALVEGDSRSARRWVKQLRVYDHQLLVVAPALAMALRIHGADGATPRKGRVCP